MKNMVKLLTQTNQNTIPHLSPQENRVRVEGEIKKKATRIAQGFKEVQTQYEKEVREKIEHSLKSLEETGIED